MTQRSIEGVVSSTAYPSQTTETALSKFAECHVHELSRLGGREQFKEFLTNDCQNTNNIIGNSSKTHAQITPDFTSVDLEQLKQKAYNFNRWATIPEGVIPLTAADSDFPIATPIKEALEEYVNQGYMNYGPASGLPQLRKAIARNRSISPDKVFVTNSAASSMFLIAQYCLSPGDEVICPDPVDFLFQRAIENAGGIVKQYELVPPRGADSSGLDHWTFRTEEASDLISSRTKMIAICNPHNPIGRVWTAEEIKQLCDIAVYHNLLIWSDEVWADISYVPFHSTASLSKEYESRTFTVTESSKGYGLAGMRLGAVLCPTKQDAEALAKISLAEDTAYGVPVLSQVAGTAALKR